MTSASRASASWVEVDRRALGKDPQHNQGIAREGRTVSNRSSGLWVEALLSNGACAYHLPVLSIHDDHVTRPLRAVCGAASTE